MVADSRTARRGGRETSFVGVASHAVQPPGSEARHPPIGETEHAFGETGLLDVPLVLD